MQQPSSLHDSAVQANHSLTLLATELAKAGVDPGTVDAVTKMVDVTKQIVSALGKGQEQAAVQSAAHAAPPPQQPPSAAAQRPFDGPTAALQHSMRTAQPPQ